MKTIALCGSITFMEQMNQFKKDLLKLGFQKVYLPVGFGKKDKSDEKIKDGLSIEEDAQRKIKHNLIKKHFKKIKLSDCILVANYTKKGIENYIGGNTFLEMGFAHVLKKRIFLINDIPDMAYTSEIIGMQPEVIRGDLSLIRKKINLSR